MSRYYVLDPRQKLLQGRPDGGWLKVLPSPAVWVGHREQARVFTLEEIEVLRKEWPYFEGCILIPVDRLD